MPIRLVDYNEDNDSDDYDTTTSRRTTDFELLSTIILILPLINHLW